MTRRKRAAIGDEHAWSETTRVEIERHIRRFIGVCQRAGQDSVAPEERWLAEHIHDVRENKGRSYARRYARNIGHHLRRSGGPPLIGGLLIRAVLHAPDNIDPLAIDLEDGNLSFSLGRAQSFADNAYRASTYQHYTNTAKKWVKRCASLGVDPTRPPLEVLEQFFEDLGQVRSASTVSSYRSALSHYFKKFSDGVDPTQAPEIDRILDGLRREKPRKQLFPFSASVRYTMLSSLEDEGVGVRDRVIILLIAFTRMSCESMVLLRVDHCRIVDDGVEIASIGNGRPVFVGTHEDRELDIVYWLRRLLAMLPSEGPLFRGVDFRRMRFADKALASTRLNKVVTGAARRAGDSPHEAAARLRLLFEAETRMGGSSVILAYQNNRKTLGNDRSESARRKRVKTHRVARSAAAQALS
jgi:hypothetical protein